MSLFDDFKVAGSASNASSGGSGGGNAGASTGGLFDDFKLSQDEQSAATDQKAPPAPAPTTPTPSATYDQQGNLTGDNPMALPPSMRAADIKSSDEQFQKQAAEANSLGGMTKEFFRGAGVDISDLTLSTVKAVGDLAGGLERIGGTILDNTAGRLVDAITGTPYKATDPVIGNAVDTLYANTEKTLGVNTDSFDHKVMSTVGEAVPWLAGGEIAKGLVGAGKLAPLVANLGFSAVQAYVSAVNDYDTSMKSGNTDGAGERALGVFGATLATNFIFHKISGILGTGIAAENPDLMVSLRKWLTTGLVETANMGGAQTVISNVSQDRAPLQDVGSSLASAAPGMFAFAALGEAGNHDANVTGAAKMNEMLHIVADHGGTMAEAQNTVRAITGETSTSKINTYIQKIVGADSDLSTKFSSNETTPPGSRIGVGDEVIAQTADGKAGEPTKVEKVSVENGEVKYKLEGSDTTYSLNELQKPDQLNIDNQADALVASGQSKDAVTLSLAKTMPMADAQAAAEKAFAKAPPVEQPAPGEVAPAPSAGAPAPSSYDIGTLTTASTPGDMQDHFASKATSFDTAKADTAEKISELEKARKEAPANSPEKKQAKIDLAAKQTEAKGMQGAHDEKMIGMTTKVHDMIKEEIKTKHDSQMSDKDLTEVTHRVMDFAADPKYRETFKDTPISAIIKGVYRDFTAEKKTEQAKSVKEVIQGEKQKAEAEQARKDAEANKNVRKGTVKERVAELRSRIKETTEKRGNTAKAKADAKGDAMKLAAAERKATGTFTGKEAKEAEKYLNSNYAGKVVKYDGKEVKVTGKQAFGRPEIQLKNGDKKYVNANELKSRDASGKDIKTYLKTQGENYLKGQEDIYGIKEGKIVATAKPTKTSSKIVVDKTESSKVAVKTEDKKTVTPQAEKTAPLKSANDSEDKKSGSDTNVATKKEVVNPEEKAVVKPLSTEEKTIVNNAAKPIQGEGKVVNSRAAILSKIADQIGSAVADNLKSETQHAVINRQEDAAKALDFVEKNPEQAKRIIDGLDGAPEDISVTNIKYAVAQKALAEGDISLANKALESDIMGGTRNAQELSMRRGRTAPNDPATWLQKAIADKIANANKESVIYDIKRGINRSDKPNETPKDKVSLESEKIGKVLTRAQMKIEEAHKIIDSLTC